MKQIKFHLLALGLTVHLSLNINAQELALNTESTQQNHSYSVFDTDSIDFKRAVQSFNSKQYESSLYILQKIKDREDYKIAYNYLSGLNYYKIQNYELAEKHMSEVVKDFQCKEIANAYFYIGLAQFQKGLYETAVNSFELAIDTSTDSSIDRKSEIMIEKALQIQNQIERDKIKWTLGFGLGFQSDSNVLNAAESDKSYRGHIINWNGFISYKAFADKDSLFEPMFYYSDMLTYNSDFKDDSDLKKSDATQILLSFPFRVNYNSFVSKSSLNLGYYLLPNDSNQKNLAISLFFFRQDVVIPVNKNLETNIKVIIGRDQSELSYSDAADNQDSIKFELGTGFNYQLLSFSGHSINGLIGYIINSAQGDNAKYNKYYAEIDYSMPSLRETESNFKAEYSAANYFKSSTDRKDNSLGLTYSITKDVTENSNLGLSLSQSYNYSTISANKYNDTVIGLQWVSIFKF